MNKTTRMSGEARHGSPLPSSKTVKRLTVVFLTILTLLQGCAHQQTELIQYSGKTAIRLCDPHSDQGLQFPGKGIFSAMGRGGGAGVAMGTQSGSIILLLGTSAVGAVVGTFYGAVTAEPRAVWKEAEGIFKKVVAEADIARTLAARTASYGNEHGYQMAVVPESPDSETCAEQTCAEQACALLARDGFKNLLEITKLSISLVPADQITEVNPTRQLVIKADATLISTTDQRSFSQRVVTSEVGSSLSLKQWMADEGKAFREEISMAVGRLCENIIAEFFMLYRFPPHVARSHFFNHFLVTGLTPVSPRLPPPFTPNIPRQCESLRPTLSWDHFANADRITYDLKVWEAVRWKVGALVYHRERLTDNFHQLETPLQPSTPYFWSVRAHFSKDGSSRVTEWSRFSIRPSFFVQCITLGLAYLLPAPEPMFYPFRTP